MDKSTIERVIAGELMRVNDEPRSAFVDGEVYAIRKLRRELEKTTGEQFNLLRHMPAIRKV